MDQTNTCTGSDRCGRCNRRLKNPEARDMGFGATCYRKTFGVTFAKARKEAAQKAAQENLTGGASEEAGAASA